MKNAVLTGVVVIILMFISYLYGKNQVEPSIIAVHPETNSKVGNIGKEGIVLPEVEVYKPGAKKAAGLPKDVQNDPSKHVLDSSRLPPSSNATTVTTVLDDKTGKVEVFASKEPKPWLGMVPGKEIRLDYGFKYGATPVGRLSFRANLFQVKTIEFDASASLDSDRDYFMGVGIGYRW